jgi:paraquat-inducible protein A
LFANDQPAAAEVKAPAQVLIACHECDALQRLATLPPGGVARCCRCGAHLASNPRGGLDTTLALASAALVTFILANVFPFLSLSIHGRVQETSLSGAALALVREDMWLLGLMVGVNSVLAPALVIGTTLYLTLAARWRRRWPLVVPLLRTLTLVRPWGMLDVFMLGVLVAIVKLGDMAQLMLGPALYAYVPLLLFSIATAATLEPRLLWERLAP